MGANAQTSVPAFQLGQVLTAQQVTEINTGTPVFAGTAERDAAFGGAGEKTLAEGQLAYIEALDLVQMYDGANWVTVGPTTPTAPGLELISSTTIGSAVSSVAVTNVFSATYDTYKIVVVGGAGSGAAAVQLQLGATTTGYYWAEISANVATGSVAANGGNNAANFRVGFMTANGIYVCGDLQNPFLTDETVWSGANGTSGFTANVGHTTGVLNNTTSYTNFTILPASGTMTGGTIRVYGYKI